MAEDAKDSEPKSQEPKKEETAIVKNQWGAVSQRIRGEGGKFVKKEKPLPPVADFVRARRKAMLRKRPGTDLTEAQALFHEVLRMAHLELKNDIKTGLPDAKMVMAKLKAAELIWQYTEGKPMSSELDNKEDVKQKVKVVVLPNPTLMHPEVRDGKNHENHHTRDDQPKFIDAEVIEDEDENKD